MADDEEWLKRYRAARERERLHSRRLGWYLVPALRFLGVASVAVEFDGQSDQGEVGEPVFASEPAAGLPEGMAEFVGHACWYALPAGWEDNAGSWGEWKLDAEDGACEIDHYWRDENEDEEGE
jgi:hypothetical protein